MPQNQWDAQVYQQDVGFVPVLGRGVLELLDPAPGERILDLGCGDGALTKELVERGATVVGIDSSPEMVAAACNAGLDARVVDAGRLASLCASGALDLGTFDAVFTNAALHWIPQISEVTRGVRSLLGPRGRFVGEFGGHGNISTIGLALNAAAALHGNASPGRPFYLPTAAEFTAELAAAGFQVDNVEIFARPTPLPTGLRGWIRAFGGPFLADVALEQREAVIDTAIELARPWLADQAGQESADYVRLRFAASAPA